MTDAYSKRLATSKAAILAKVPPELQKPRVAIVCGSGLSGLAEQIQDKVLIEYADIGFTKATVQGHSSTLAFGYLSSARIPVVAQMGRFHAYEGHPMSDVIFPMRIFGQLGVEMTIITNAAGGLRDGLTPGTIVALRDHVSLASLTSWNPLIGPNDSSLGPRFPPMSDAYDFELRKNAFIASSKLSFPSSALTEGTYAWVAGPSYESSAEGKFLKSAGADVVGMSTIPEVIAARHMGIRVLVLSLVTNSVISAPYRDARAAAEAELAGKPIEEPELEKASHEEVLEMSMKKAEDMKRLVEKIVELTCSK